MNMSDRLSSLAPFTANDARENVERLAGTLTSARENLGRMVSDLDRNVRYTVKPLVPMLRRRPLAVASLGGLTFFLIGGALIGNALRLARQARQRRRRIAHFAERARRVGRAMTRLLENPDRVAQPTPGIGREVLGAVGTVVAVTVAKRLIDRAI